MTISIILSFVAVIPVQAANYDETSYALTGVQVNDIVEIARTQVGYHEGNNLSQLDGTYSGSGNYTKYARDLANAGYGASNPNAWCAFFVSWCAMKAGCLNSAVSFFTGVNTCVARSRPYSSNGLGKYHGIKKHTFTGDTFSKGYYTPATESYTPKKGDIMVNKSHVGLVISDYNPSTNSFSVIDGNNNHMVSGPRTVYLNNSELVGFVTPDYTTTSITPSHTHSYSYSHDTSHPHLEYKYCSCGTKEYTGNRVGVSSCTQCYPVGNVNLTRSFEKTKGTAVFYRNNVYNANSYILKLYKNNSLYNTYTMNKQSYNVSGLPSGNYYAALYVKNTNTGEERSAYCTSFKIADTYTVSYNANGGNNAPTSQTKIEDTSLTLTSSIPNREGYIFKGWASSKNATEAQYQTDGTYTKNAKITLYAVWEPEIYTVSFDTNGGIGIIENQTITYGNTMKMPNTIVKDYSYLLGWSTNKNATKPEYPLGTDCKIKSNLKLYAVWENATWNNEVADSLKGSGTENDPYLISTAADLAYLANKVNIQTSTPTYDYYKMTDNINLAYNEWVPIGVYGNKNQYFYGSFDGNGYTISDLYITQPNQNYVGLFGYVKDSKIKNLTVTGAIESIEADGALNIGGIVGYATATNLTELSVKYFNIGGMSVDTGTSSVGTIVGTSEKGTIDSCKSEDCSINLKSGSYNAGMVVGYCLSDIYDCSVSSTDEGLFSAANSVKNSNIGGMCGVLSNTAERCSVNAPYFSNNIKTTSSRIGGFVGQFDGEVKVCSVKFTDSQKNSMKVEGSSSIYLGGFSGYSGMNAKITDCKLDGKSVSASTSSGAAYAGGLIGYANAKANQTVSVTGGLSLSYASLPKKDGYKAIWYTDSDYKTLYDFSQTITSDMTLYAKWEKGDNSPDIWDGTSKEPAYNAETKTYTITNGEELAWVSDVTNGVITSGTNFPTDITFSGYTVELANDIYLNDVTEWESWKTTSPANTWKPIGRRNYFSGTFNGNNFSVYGCYYNNDDTTSGYSYAIAGLFSAICEYSEIKNVTSSCSYIYGAVAGGIVGRACTSKSSGTIKISNCHNKGTVIASSEAGGILGTVVADSDLIIINCSNRGSISSASDAGGIVGNIDNYPCSCKIENCYNKGKITISKNYSRLGGIVGCVSSPNTRIADYYNTGYIHSNYGGWLGGICGRDSAWSNEYYRCYNTGKIVGISGDTFAGIIGTGAGVFLHYCYSTDSNATYGLGYFDLSRDGDDVLIRSKLEYSYACNSNVYGYFNNSSAYKPDLYSAKYVSVSNLKNLANLTGFSASVWGTNSSINSGYPYLKSMEETYKTYTVTAVTDEDNATVNRTFVNIDGDISGNYAGSIIGYGNGGTSASSVAKNIVGMADNVSAVTSEGSSVAYSGGLIGYNNDKFTFENAYYNSEMNVTSSTGNVDTTGTARSKKTMNTTFYTNILGLTPYSSLDNLKDNDKAVWVLKNGELPELYYNCLNDITVSSNIENGTVTVDKAQAIDGETVTVTATPNENYVLNKIYVNGEEKDGTNFIVSGDSEVFVTFSEKIAEYNVAVMSNENATANLFNADSAEPMLISIAEEPSTTDTLTAKDGEEILVTTNADEDYTVDTVYVNGEEIAGDSFILTDNATVTMEVINISTDIEATTNEPSDVGSCFAVVGGSIANADENTVKYIRYWSADDTENIYTTEAETGSGTYTAELMDLKPSTTYYYQMTEQGEIKSFTTMKEENDTIDEDSGEDNNENGNSEESKNTEPITSTTYKKLTSTYKFSIEASQALESEVILVATYTSENKMISYRIVECDGDTSYTASVPIDKNIDYAKIFVWSNLNGLKPLAGVETVKITN